MLKKTMLGLFLTLSLLSTSHAGATAVDDYVEQAFGDTGARWLLKAFRKLGTSLIIDVVPDRDIGVRAAQLAIDGDGALFAVTVQYGPSFDPPPPLLRIR